MVKLVCAKCGRGIPAEDINVAKDVAYCRECNVAYALAALTQRLGLDIRADTGHPPAGAWYRRDGAGMVVGATNRSLVTGIAALIFGLFWNGLLSVFLLFVITGTLHNLHVPLPAFLPEPKMNGAIMGPGETAFLWVFLLPFILVGVFMAGTVFNCLWGKTEVCLDGETGKVFVGVGRLGYRRRFAVRSVREVAFQEQVSYDSDSGTQRKKFIVLETREGKRLKFGSMMTEERRQFVAGALRQALVK